MALHRIALIIHPRSSSDEFLLARQSPPPMPSGDEYRSYTDSDLFDLPSAPLTPLGANSISDPLVICPDSLSGKLDLLAFDIKTAIEQALSQVGLGLAATSGWEFRSYAEEADFGPGLPVHSVFVTGRLIYEEVNIQDICRWMDIPKVSKLLSGVNPGYVRIGSLVTTSLLSEPAFSSRKWEVPSSLHFQEYPPGVTIVPMRSRTSKPFWTTNLVVVAPTKDINYNDCPDFFNSGEALLMDPGCCSKYHAQLAELVSALPRKLVVVVTHHHPDHIDGLSIVQKCNPDAVLLAHENTMARIGRDEWSISYKPVHGGEKISIGDQQLEVIFAPGHTDGHIALLHVGTNALVVGDHCVGQGSALLDVNAGGNMKNYFETTYKFMELSPHVIIPMHGRVNLWPKQLLSSYLKNRRDRELSILSAIFDGARTLYDVVSTTYAHVDVKLWVHASSNVRLHVDHLAYQGKLPMARLRYVLVTWYRIDSTSMSEICSGDLKIADPSSSEDFSIDTFHSSYDAFFAQLDVAKANT